MTDLYKKLLVGLIVGWSVCVCAPPVFGQTRCLSPEEVKTMLAQVKSQRRFPFDKQLQEKLIGLKQRDQKRTTADVAGNKKPDDLFKGLKESRERNATELCGVLKTHGWPTPDMVGADGVDAAFFLLKNSSPQLQLDLLQVVIAAVNLGAIPRAEFPGYFDLLRLKVGLKQLFGTQATIINGFLVLFPIEAEAHVDARRKQFELGPLAEHLRSMERVYRLPLIRSTGALTNSFSESAKKAVAKTTASGLFEGQTVEEDDVVRVDTNLVSLNASVYSNKLRTNVSMLGQKDFTITEDGRPETISFFGTTDVPFDLVLLLDLSGSTSGKRDLIRKSTQRFIEAARPSDRLAIVTFADVPHVISPLTEDRQKLLESTGRIEGAGGSNIWGSLKFTLDEVIGPKSLNRRRAVVLMTDGLDNNLGGFLEGTVSFADLVEAVRRNDALIIPIYLEGSDSFKNWVSENARKTLELLAEESGGLFYKARKIEDLKGVYAQVIEDLGKVYSLGYKPTNEKRDGSWRAVKIEIPNQPDLKARARPGYYAN